MRAAAAEPAKAPVKAPAKASAKVKVTKPKPSVRTDVETSLTESDRLRMIELAAFFRAERRGFVPGFEADDWFAAEAEIAAQIPAPPAAKPEVVQAAATSAKSEASDIKQAQALAPVFVLGLTPVDEAVMPYAEVLWYGLEQVRRYEALLEEACLAADVPFLPLLNGLLDKLGAGET